MGRLRKTTDQRRIESYGITVTTHSDMFEKQKGRCAICGIHEKALNKSLSIDHCHQSGKVRGLLCPACNSMLGFCEDSMSTLKSAIKYLKQFEKKINEENAPKGFGELVRTVDYG